MAGMAQVPVVCDDEVTGIDGVVAAQVIRQAVDAAREAFWLSIVNTFPQATSGDLTPEELEVFTWATNYVVKQWLRHNVEPPPVDADEPRPLPKEGVVFGRGRVRVLSYDGNGMFTVLTSRDERVSMHRDRITFIK